MGLMGRRNVGVKAREEWGVLEEFGVEFLKRSFQGSAKSQNIPAEYIQVAANLVRDSVFTSVQEPITPLLFATLLIVTRKTWFERQKSVKLQNMITSQGKLQPDFKPTRSKYTLYVPKAIQSVAIRAVPRTSDATVKVAYMKKKEPGIQDVQITVRHKRKMKTYQVRIKRGEACVLNAGVYCRPKRFELEEEGVYDRGEDAYFLASKILKTSTSAVTKKMKLDSIPEIDRSWPGVSESLEKVSAIGISDGVGGWRESGVDPGEFSRQLMYVAGEALILTPDDENPSPGLSPKDAMKFAQKTTVIPGTATASILSIDENTWMLNAANVGDSGFLVIRKGKVLVKSDSQLYEFNMPYQLGNLEIEPSANTANDAQLYNVQLQPDDLIILATDGLFDNVSIRRIQRMAEEFMSDGNKTPQQFAKELNDVAFIISRDEDAKTPFAKEVSKQVIPGWRRSLGKKLSGGKRDDITVVVAVVKGTML
eukprot:CAMPEP_0167757786 /NCGR_PEP_ID=MMETSP0110_2-20121227/10114_1 /TAXON_ID=629695 /ORGANISM="Gymnochlora sp., Strain CCMP2014" /LENGTH=479 /DNA_ID=CAMNT_0007644005 /DNA_START=44 /DNA_END=1483 /DNA_ORIENTATION=+